MVCRHVLSAKFSEAGLGLLDRDHDGTISEEELVGLGKEVRGHMHCALRPRTRACARGFLFGSALSGSDSLQKSELCGCAARVGLSELSSAWGFGRLTVCCVCVVGSC